MNHEEALIYALAGGPAPIEAKAHLESCPLCAEDLRGLCEVEDLLRSAAPTHRYRAEVPPTLAAESVRRSADRRSGFTAAAAVLALACLTAWWIPRGRPSGEVTAPRASAASYAWSAEDYGTTAVLDSLQEELAADSSSGEGPSLLLAANVEGEFP